MYNNYDVEMQSRSYPSTGADAHRQRKIEADACRHRDPASPLLDAAGILDAVGTVPCHDFVLVFSTGCG